MPIGGRLSLRWKNCRRSHPYLAAVNLERELA